jgi:hypothetical protein
MGDMKDNVKILTELFRSGDSPGVTQSAISPQVYCPARASQHAAVHFLLEICTGKHGFSGLRHNGGIGRNQTVATFQWSMLMLLAATEL